MDMSVAVEIIVLSFRLQLGNGVYIEVFFINVEGLLWNL